MRYLILGVTEVRDGHGGSLPLGGPRLRALLAALALRPGRPVAVGELVDEVWGGEPPQDAPAALQALVGRLRRVLGKEAIDSVPGGYRLAAVVDDIDLYVFERLAREGADQLDGGDPRSAARTLRAALALWRGAALADLPDRDRGVRPEAQRLAALQQRIEADLRRGATATLVPELRELAADHPYDEPFRAQLIRALWAEGRQADALAAYEDTRRVLADGLGADPGPELTSLQRQLLAATGAGAARATAPATATAVGDGTGTSSPREFDAAPVTTADTALRLDIDIGSGADAGAGAGADSDPGADSVGEATTGAPAGDSHEPHGNLRPRLTSFVGRESELHAIRADLRRSRLVTLTGPGGSGKTRLAEEAAPRNAWLVELAPLDHPSAVPGAVLSALGLRETQLAARDGRPARDDPTARLVDHLARSGTLLVLDNCEHVIGAAAALAETLLVHCPGLRILATSREPLGVPGESVRPVEPLPPDPAHRLFDERAGAVRPGFDPAGDPEAVAEICRRLDGLPLAIELAAARLRMLTPRQIADRLDDRFRLLTSGSRTVLPRQQTLRAVVDWSWDLLDERERRVLREVSVFAGGWDLTAAEGVCGGAPADPSGDVLADPSGDVPGTPSEDVPGTPSPAPAGGASHGSSGRASPGAAADASHVPDLLGALVDKSLVVATPVPGPGPGGAMRYHLLETIHEYAAERAAETPAVRSAAERAHSAYFAALAEEAEPRLRSRDQLPWIRGLEVDLDNIRAALHRAVLARDEETTLRLVFAMGWFWWLRNHRPEGLAWAECALGLGPEPAGPDDPRYWPRMHLQVLRVFLAGESGQTERIRTDAHFQELVLRIREAFGRPGPQSARFPGLLWVLVVYANDEKLDIHALMDSSIANCRAHGGDWETGVLLMGRTHMIVDMPGGAHGVDRDLTELRELSRRVGDRWMRAQVASVVGEAGMARGRYEEARDAYEEALRFAGEVGAHAEAPFLLARLAELSYRAGDTDAAERRLDRAAEEAERYQVQDARAFVHLMRAVFALDRGETSRARLLLDEARSGSVRGSPPPHFAAVTSALDARIAAYETKGPVAAARSLAAVLRTARESRLTDPIVAQLAEMAAPVVLLVGDPRRAVRILAAANTWRAGYPRSVPEWTEARRIETLARAELGEREYEAEHEAGRPLTPDQIADLLELPTRTVAPPRERPDERD
ncbi:BTAD domain-containing putative transcriptional regulator [Streptomyces sp. 35G-GA-8]|uniref:AfsR/SARP family transcriptional regulator n=1 Tax=Streptomyces sp. 35G-GA-8 TaxID=2939434 RepID=UPI00201ED720|nr:BTAD domain-containing putative transcriptional regulator [Streptomyces sp. 35G-GA-8]MCL7379753.1 winged helix-turn-helix domain-containing protein [Streptomyces sp. 35G-GA-8]